MARAKQVFPVDLISAGLIATVVCVGCVRTGPRPTIELSPADGAARSGPDRIATSAADSGRGTGASPDRESVKRLLDDGRPLEALPLARQLFANNGGEGSAGNEANGTRSLAWARSAALLAEALLASGAENGEEAHRLASDALETERPILGPDASRAPELADTLDVTAATLAGRDDRQALSLLRESLEIRERAFGTVHPAVAASCHAIGRLLTETLDLASARTFIERAETIRRDSLGPEHLDTIRTRHALGLLLLEEADLSASADALEGALAAAEMRLGPKHPEVAEMMTSLAMRRLADGPSDTAAALLEQALAIHRGALGEAHPQIARDLRIQANLFFDRQQVEEARDGYAQAHAILERAFGPDGPRLIPVLMDDSTRLRFIEQPDAARATAQNALEIATRQCDPEGVWMARALSNFGVVLTDRAELAEAKASFERAIANLRAQPGRTSSDLPETLTRFSRTLIALGDVLEAKRQLEEAIRIWTDLVGAEHLRIASSYNQLARVLSRQRDFDGALALRRKQLEINERVYGAEHTALVTPLVTLAEMYRQKLQYEPARPLIDRALAIAEKTYGPDSLRVSFVLGFLGNIQWSMEEFAAARATYERAIALQKRFLGGEHTQTVNTLQSLAIALWDQGEVLAALDTAAECEASSRALFLRTARSLSEREAIRFGYSRVQGLDIMLAAVASPKSSELPAGTRARVLDAVVRSRALVLDEMAERHRRIVAAESAEAGKLQSRYEKALKELSRLIVSDFMATGAADANRRLAAARAEVESSERALAAESSQFRREQDRSFVGLDDVKHALPRDGALVSFVRYREPDYDAYVALVQTPDEADPAVVALGDAGEIDTLVGRWKESISTPPPASPRESAKAEADYRSVAERLRKAVWDPVAERLENARIVFVVFDGALHVLNLATLPTSDGGYLVEKGPLFQILSAEHDLAGGAAAATRGEGILLLGGPDYDGGARVSSSPAPAVVRFTALPRSIEEVRQIATLWREHARERNWGERVRHLEGIAATEESVRRLAPESRVVHLATHGFFQEREDSAAREPAAKPGPPGRLQVLERPPTSDPLLVTGLALAGANRGSDEVNQGDDGILTAQEVASLDLTRVDWVVLSGCETGVGKVVPSEGVLGLRRAVQIAGARTLIMSLWRVRDESTRFWMRELYAARLRGESSVDSVRRASIATLEARRRMGFGTHPFSWGAFVSAGDWR